MKQQLENPLFEKYTQLLKQFNQVEDSETLRKYKILKEMYSTGKEIYGQKFSLARLSDDLDIPYTTVKRIMSLSKANFNTWKKIKDGKISVFRVAYILSTKDVTYQDEIIDMCIEKGLSTYDIKKMRIKDYKDVDKARLQVAVEKGFSRKDSAFQSFSHTINRLDLLLDLNKEDLPEGRLPLLNKKLGSLNKKITKFIENLNGKHI